ncbi:MAG TPA: hypothetical protein VGH28_00310 [Polyangiaceae bacterium]|jgi:hypothetical protein
MSTRKLFVVSFLALAVGACGGTVGRRIDTAQVTKIQTCVTTESDLLAWFGEPRTRGNENGFATMTWSYAHVHAGGGETQSLSVTLNPRGRVVQYRLNPIAATTDVKDICPATSSL